MEWKKKPCNHQRPQMKRNVQSTLDVSICGEKIEFNTRRNDKNTKILWKKQCYVLSNLSTVPLNISVWCLSILIFFSLLPGTVCISIVSSITGFLCFFSNVVSRRFLCLPRGKWCSSHQHIQKNDIFSKNQKSSNFLPIRLNLLRFMEVITKICTYFFFLPFIAALLNCF